MPNTAADIMNRNFLDASHAESIQDLLRDMADLGVDSAPVMDGAGHPLGVVSVRDVETCHDVEELADHLTHSAVSVDQNTPIELAAWTAAARRADGIVLVDEHGVAVGALSALDLLRALLGLEAREGVQSRLRPSTSWSEDEPLEIGPAHSAPDAPGIILLLPAGEGAQRRVWAEATRNIQERLDQMLRIPQDDPALEAILEEYPRRVRFRYLVVPDTKQCERLARVIHRMTAKLAAEATSDPAGSASRSGTLPSQRDPAH